MTVDNINKMIDYCIKIPEKDEYEVGHRYPYYSCELLCSINGLNIDRLLEKNNEGIINLKDECTNKNETKEEIELAQEKMEKEKEETKSEIKNIKQYENKEESEEKEEEEEEQEEKSNFCYDLKILSCHSLYLISMMCRCILHGLNTCLHFWLADFMRNVIHEKNQLKITICYSVICFAGPLCGILANIILKPIIGQYDSKKASWPLVILQLIASIFAVSIGFMKSTLTVSLATILFLMFNSSALPLLQGILISCVDKQLGATGFAIANILTQVLTSGTTPLLYGIINDKYKEKYPSLAMICIMSLQFIAVPLLSLLAYLRNKKFDEREKELKEEQGEELIEK